MTGMTARAELTRSPNKKVTRAVKRQPVLYSGACVRRIMGGRNKTVYENVAVCIRVDLRDPLVTGDYNSQSEGETGKKEKYIYES